MTTNKENARAKKIANQMLRRAASGHEVDYQQLIEQHRDDPALAKEFEKLGRIESARRAAVTSALGSRSGDGENHSSVSDAHESEDERDDFHIPDYQLIRPIGSGGFGTVFLGRNLHDGQYYAVKVVQEGREADLHGIREFKQRAHHNPHLVPIGHVGKIDGVYYYVMPLADDAGESKSLVNIESYEPLTLQRYFSRMRPVPLPEVIQIAEAMLLALEGLHSVGGIHRDVKPANIIRLNGKWRLGDPGLMSSDAVALGQAGTPGYSPEAGPRDSRVDLYGLGKTLFVVATGLRLNQFADFQEGKIELDRSDVRLDRICQTTARACAVRPEDRFQSVGDMRAAMFVADTPGRARPWKVLTGLAAAAIIVAAFFTSRFNVPRATIDDSKASVSLDVPSGDLAAIELPGQPTATSPTNDRPSASLDAATRVSLTAYLFRNRSGEVDGLSAPRILGPPPTPGDSVATYASCDDVVYVEVEFDQPVYAYVIALNPDGSWTYLNGAESVPPGTAKQLKAPGGINGYQLTDGAGAQAIIVAVSDEPLAPFAEWRAAHSDTVDWSPMPSERREVWFAYQGDFEAPFAEQQRGDIRPLLDAPSCFVSLAKSFQQHQEFNAVQLLGFQVNSVPAVDSDFEQTQDIGQANTKIVESESIAPPTRFDIPPWQRELPDEMEQRLSKLKEEVDEQFNDRNFANVANVFERQSAILLKGLGADHWRTIEASTEKSIWETAATFSDEQRQRLLDAIGNHYESMNLDAQGDIPMAEQAGNVALRLFRETLGPDSMYTLVAAYFQGTFVFLNGDEPAGIELLTDTWQRLTKTLGAGHPKTLRGCIRLLDALRHHGEFAAAEEVIRQVLPPATNQNGPADNNVLGIRANFADVLNSQDRPQEAEEMIRQTLSDIRGLPLEPLTYATLRVRLSQSLGQQDRVVEAEQELLAVIDVYTSHLTEERYEQIILNKQFELAKVWCQLGRYEDARLLLQRIRKPREKFYPADSIDVTELNWLYVAALNKVGRREEALDVLQAHHQQLSATLPTDHVRVRRIAAKIGKCLSDMDRLDEATLFLQPLVEDAPGSKPAHGSCDLAYAGLLVKRKEFPEAERYIERARRWAIEQGESLDWMEHLAQLRSHQGRFDEAIDLFSQLMTKRLGPAKSDNRSQRLLTSLARCHFANQDYLAAVEYGTKSNRLFRDLRQRNPGFEGAFIEDASSPAQLLACSLAHLGRYHDAWRVLDESVSSALRNELLFRQQHVSAKLFEVTRKRESCEHQLERYRSANRQSLTEEDNDAMQTLTSELALLRRQEDVQRRELIHTEIGHGQKSLAEVQATMDSETALVYWLKPPVTPDSPEPSQELWACVLRHRGEPTWTKLDLHPSLDATESTLAERVSSHRDADDHEIQRIAQTLRVQKLDPLLPLLDNSAELPPVRNLVVVAFDETLELPLEIAIATDERLDARLTVSYTPSANVFAMLRERRAETVASESPTLLLVSASTDELPATRLSVDGISRRFDDQSKLVLIGDEASENRIHELATSDAMRSFEVIHFALHGYADDKSLMRTYLHLPGRNSDDALQQLLQGAEFASDGRIYASQVRFGWKLDAELVTIAACASNRGVASRTQGELGFSQALLSAGAQRAILSQWPVDDQATAILMDRFYGNFCDREMRASDALAEAKRFVRTLTAAKLRELFSAANMAREPDRSQQQRGMIRPLTEPNTTNRPFAHPYYWAGFILIGDL